MDASTLNIIAKVMLFSLLATFIYSCLLMIGGKNIFKKASQKEATVYYPIINLFTMLEITQTSIYVGILFFIPIVNVFALLYMFYRLGVIFNASTLYKIGLVIIPVIFYPLLAFSKLQYKVKNENMISIETLKRQNINLMTQDELNRLNESLKDDDTPKVDSIFKGVLEQREKVAPYKAVKMDVLGLEKLKDSNINEKVNSQETINSKNGNFEIKEIDDVEYIDL